MKRLLALNALCLILMVSGCGRRINYYVERTISNVPLHTISQPYLNINNQEVILLVWGEAVTPVAGEEMGWSYSNDMWEAFPIEKIPGGLKGQYVNKNATLHYRVVSPGSPRLKQPPLVFIIELTVNE